MYKKTLVFLVVMILFAVQNGGVFSQNQLIDSESGLARLQKVFTTNPYLSPSEKNLMFVENVGQFDQNVRFQVRGDHSVIWLTQDGIWLMLVDGDNQLISDSLKSEFLEADTSIGFEKNHSKQGVNIKFSFVNANSQPRIEPIDRITTHISYFFGQDGTDWHSDVPVWSGVRYVDIYPGVDLEISSVNNQWDWRFVPRSSSLKWQDQVQLRVEGVDHIFMDGDVEAGNGRNHLILQTQIRDLIFPLPSFDGVKNIVTFPQVNLFENVHIINNPFSYARPIPSHNNQITDLSDLLYSTLLSDVSNEMALAIATDGSGSVYLTGVAFAWHFSTTPGAFDTTYNGGSRDVFIAKLNQDGTGLTYSTFLGGSESDNAYAIAVDNTGAVYVTGETTSSNFPTTPGAFQAEMAEHPAGPIDAFAVKLNPLGTELVYSSYLGGSVWERGRNIAVDATGSAVITGSTGSPNFPTVPGGYDARFNFSLHYVFIVKINSTGTSLIFTSFLGITDTNYRQGIALDLSGSVYVTGVTEHSHFPTTPGAFDPIYNGGHDVYIVKLNSSGTDLLFSSFLGGSGDDYGFSIAVDSAGSAYVTGETASSNFPVTVNAFNTSYSGGLCAESPNQYLCPDAFVAKLNSNGDTLMYATFLGGNGDDKGYSIAVDETGAAFITGKTSSPGFPTTSNAYQGSYSGGTCGYEPYTFPCADSFAVKLSPDGTALGYSTFLGKQKQEEGYSIALDATGAAYIVGTTGSFDFPTTPGAFRSNPVFVPNSFIVKLLMGTEDYTPLPTPTPFPTPIPTPTSVPVQNNWTFILYLAGDNNLYPYLNRAIRRLESLPQNPLVNIVVLFDGDRNNDSWRFHVQSDGTYTLGVNKWYMGELNTGNPHVLADFVIWARQNYPADHYYLAIANHGRGTSGVAWDETNSNDNLTTSELRSALNIATNSGIWKVDVLQYDTCLMAMFENAYQVKDYANYMVFSQNLGWSVFAYSDYSQIQDITDANSPYEFATLVNSITSSTTPRQFAMDLAAAYFNHPAIENYPRTISAVDLSEAVSVRTAINTFAVTLGSNLQAIKGYIQNARFAVQKFDSRDYYKITQDDEYVDLYHFADVVKRYVPLTAVQNTAQSVMDAVNQMVIVEYHQSGMWGGELELYWDLDNAHGLSIFFPPRSGSIDYSRYISHGLFHFTTDGLWDDFLMDYFGVTGLPPEIPLEPVHPPMLTTCQKTYLPIVIKHN